MKFICWFLQITAPIVTLLGFLGVFAALSWVNFPTLIIAAVLYVIGFIFGIFAHKLDMPARWKWAKSKNESYAASVKINFFYAWIFAAWPFSIYFLNILIKGIINGGVPQPEP